MSQDWTVPEGAQLDTSINPSPNPFEPDASGVASALDNAKNDVNNFEQTIENATQGDAFNLKPGDENAGSTDAAHPFEHVKDDVEQKAKNAEEQIKQAAEQTSQQIEGKANEVKSSIQNLEQVAENASNQVKEACSKVEQKLESAIDSIKDSELAKTLGHAAEEAENEVKDAFASVENTVEEAKSKIEATIGGDENKDVAADAQKNTNLVRNIGICAVGVVAVFLIARFISKRRK